MNYKVILADNYNPAVMQTLLTSRPACSTRIVCISAFRENPSQLNPPGDYKMLPFITSMMYQEKRVLLFIAFRWLHRIPRVSEHLAECEQSPYRISQRRSPTPGGSWMKDSGSLSVLGNIQIGFCRYLENTLAICLQVTQKIRSKGFMFKCKVQCGPRTARVLILLPRNTKSQILIPLELQFLLFWFSCCSVSISVVVHSLDCLGWSKLNCAFVYLLYLRGKG